MNILIVGSAILTMLLILADETSQGFWLNDSMDNSTNPKHDALFEDDILDYWSQSAEEMEKTETTDDRRNIREEVVRYM